MHGEAQIDLKDLHQRASVGFDSRVQAIGDDQWDAATPCTEWTVRDLVNHLVGEQLWAAELLAGKTVPEVGDRFEGDLLGDDPVAAWDRAAVAAGRVVIDVDLDATVHLSFGDFPAGFYIAQLTTDLVVHSWDLARGIGADDELDPDLVEFVYRGGLEQRDTIRASGKFGPEVEVPDHAGTQTKMLALFGRAED